MPLKAPVTGLNHHPYQSSHPGNPRLDLNIAARDNLSSFTQRVMSAKLLRLKQLQNQLAEAHLQINDLCSENRLLRSLQKRQDLALDRYEGTQAQLPQLVRSHQEEVRVLRTKYKNLKCEYRNVTKSLKERELELQNLKEQHAHLLKLSKDRHLGEREFLSKQVDDLKSTVDSQASTIQVLNRKLLLETKNLKFQLHQEIQRHKSTQLDLQQTFLKVDHLQAQLDQAKERNVLPPSMDRLGKTASSARLTGVLKPYRTMSVSQNSNVVCSLKKPAKERVSQSSALNSEPSSGQPESSPATSSERTNEFDTSFDSSPEHIVLENNRINADDIFVRQSGSYPCRRGSKQNCGNDFSVPLGFSKDVKKNSIKENVDLSEKHLKEKSEMLEKEYENAVAMLNELSTKHKASFEEDILCSFSSLDKTSAKHVAALANATFASRSESQSASGAKVLLDELSSGHRSSLQDEDTLIKVKSHQASVRRDEKRPNRNSISSGTSFAALSKPSANQQAEKILEPFKVSDEFSDNIMDKNESFSLKSKLRSAQLPNNIDNEGTVTSKANEELEVSRKEALLKALKAIDENSSKGSDSESSDSAAANLSKSVQRKFTSLNSSGIGGGDSKELPRRRKDV